MAFFLVDGVYTYISSKQFEHTQGFNVFPFILMTIDIVVQGKTTEMTEGATLVNTTGVPQKTAD